MYITIMSNRLETDQARHFVGPDLDPNCLQCLSADDKSKKLMRRESILTLCMLGIHVSVVVCCLFFSKLPFPKKSFRNSILVSNGLDPDQERRSLRPGLSTNCLQI